MLIRFALALFALLLPLSAHAQSLEGSWDLRVEGATVFRFEIEEGLDGEWLGQWQRPQQFNSNGNAFYNMRGGVKTTPSMTGILFLDMVELAFDDPRPGAIPDIFRFRLTGPDSAEMIYVGTDLAPYAMVRAAPGTPIGDWDATRVYRRTVAGPQNDGQLERVVPGVKTSVIDASRKCWDGQVAFAMVPTLARPGNLADMPRLDLLVIDEAHHAVADSYRRIIDRVRDANPDAKIFGVTATPNRGDKKGLREVFDNVADQVGARKTLDVAPRARRQTGAPSAVPPGSCRMRAPA